MNEAIERYTSKIAQVKTEIVQLDKKLEDAAAEIESFNQSKGIIQAEIDRLYKEIKANRKEANAYAIIDTIDCVIDDYVTQTRRAKLKQLEEVVTVIFRSLIRKEDFIREIRIDPENEQFKIYNRLNNEVPESNLSAGERQIFILPCYGAC